jgi:hypothetical protein
LAHHPPTSIKQGRITPSPSPGARWRSGSAYIILDLHDLVARAECPAEALDAHLAWRIYPVLNTVHVEGRDLDIWNLSCPMGRVRRFLVAAAAL